MDTTMLEFAINMELSGQKYYEEQAALHAKDALKVVFQTLADEESGHARLLQNMRDGLTIIQEAPEQPGLKDVFSGMAAFKIDVKDSPAQLDAYRMALEKERQSIDLYRKFAADGGDADFFAFLVQQEEEHFDILEEIVRLVNRPESWVESAEFGLREEY